MTPSALPPALPTRLTYPLNVFQRLMRAWRELGPYNAGQIIAVREPMAQANWQAAAHEAVAQLGLGIPQVSAGGVTFSGGGPVRVDKYDGTLAAAVVAQLNTPFGDDEIPVRFFIAPGDGGGHYFGIFYDHWLADSRSIRNLMQRIYVARRHPEMLPDLPALAVGPRAQASAHESPAARGAAGEWWAGLRTYARHRRAHRLDIQQPMDFSAGCLFANMRPGLISQVVAASRKWHCSVHDIFLAAAAQSLGAFTAEERYRPRKKLLHPRRDRVALGTIVDARGGDSPQLENVFGLYLSCFTTAVTMPEAAKLADLAGAIARQTRRVKNSGRAASGRALYQAEFWWGLHHDPRRRALLFQKNVPLAAGVSNVNLTGQWMDPAVNEDIEVYMRISPTGPLLPLVFTLTTLGERLSLCATYRRAAFQEAQARHIVADFIQRLEAGIL